MINREQPSLSTLADLTETNKPVPGLVKFDEQTLFKVNMALQKSGLTAIQAFNAINEMLNAGILFRERFDGKV